MVTYSCHGLFTPCFQQKTICPSNNDISICESNLHWPVSSRIILSQMLDCRLWSIAESPIHSENACLVSSAHVRVGDIVGSELSFITWLLAACHRSIFLAIIVLKIFLSSWHPLHPNWSPGALFVPQPLMKHSTSVTLPPVLFVINVSPEGASKIASYCADIMATSSFLLSCSSDFLPFLSCLSLLFFEPWGLTESYPFPSCLSGKGCPLPVLDNNYLFQSCLSCVTGFLVKQSFIHVQGTKLFHCLDKGIAFLFFSV